MSDHAPTHPHPRSRSIGYRIEDPAGALDTARAEALLARAKRAGTVTEYDTGRGHVLWFNGPPGARMRALRDAMVVEVGGRVAPAPKEPTR